MYFFCQRSIPLKYWDPVRCYIRNAGRLWVVECARTCDWKKRGLIMLSSCLYRPQAFIKYQICVCGTNNKNFSSQNPCKVCDGLRPASLSDEKCQRFKSLIPQPLKLSEFCKVLLVCISMTFPMTPTSRGCDVKHKFTHPATIPAYVAPYRSFLVKCFLPLANGF